MQTDPEPRPEGQNRLTPEFFLAELYRLTQMAEETNLSDHREFYLARIDALHARWARQGGCKCSKRRVS